MRLIGQLYPGTTVLSWSCELTAAKNVREIVGVQHKEEKQCGNRARDTQLQNYDAA